MNDEPHQGAGALTPPPGLGELERAVMDIVWNAPEATVREVLRALNEASERERAYTTVMTVMGNLRQKGLLACRRQGRTGVYSPTLSRAQYTDARARFDVETLVSQYGDIALAHIAREMAGLDERCRDQLRKLAAGA